ncbi:MAG: hypothetical protein CMP09_02795 [Yangia sp.]|nr:hypothetical protein [Salipiger sp.]
MREALRKLKLDLADIGSDVVRSDRASVSLAPGQITILYQTPACGTFLEGIDPKVTGDCEGFEDWLREMRQGRFGSWPEDALEEDAMLWPGPAAVQRRQSHVALGILALRQAGLAEADRIRAESVLDGIARYATQVAEIDIHDLRGGTSFAAPLPVEKGLGATHLIQAIAERRNRNVLVHLRLHEATRLRLIWVSQPIDVQSESREELICAAAEAMLQTMVEHPGEGDPSDLFPWTALTGLFSLDAALIARTEEAVATLAADGGPPVFECLRIFAQIFKVNEGLARADATSAEHICETLSRMSDAHPMLPLSMSLAGYSAHMLLGDNDLAEALVRRADELAPNLALNLDHLAVIRLMRGDLDGAEAAQRRCLQAGAASPWRYTYEVSGAMIAMARGDVRQALLFANQALIRKPRFIGALRYAMLGFALSEHAQDARRMQTRIRTLRPDYDFDGWTEAMLRRTPPHLSGRLTEGLNNIGIF